MSPYLKLYLLFNCLSCFLAYLVLTFLLLRECVHLLRPHILPSFLGGRLAFTVRNTVRYLILALMVVEIRSIDVHLVAALSDHTSSRTSDRELCVLIRGP